MKGKGFFRGGILIFLILGVALLAACGGQTKTQEPQLTVTAGDQELKVIYYGDRHNETRDEINRRLRQAMEGVSLEEIPYVDLGEEITIKAENFKTEKFAISDYVLKDNGEIRYQEKTAQKSEIQVTDAAAAFDLNSHPAVFLSSYSGDYEPGKTIRGFVVRSDIDGASFAFAFILRTDAGNPEAPEEQPKQ